MSTARRLLLSAIVATCLLAAVATPASAAFKVGRSVELLQGNCAPQIGYASYSQQQVAGAGAPSEPKVGELFWVGVTVEFQQYFECAADFWSAVLTLPAGLTPAVGAPAPSGGTLQLPVCTRRAFGPNGQIYDDARMAANCPTALGGANTLSFNAGTRELRIGPKPNPGFPDNGAGYFFIGQNSPAENLVYTRTSVLIPVRATQAINASMPILLCTVGTTCTSGRGDGQSTAVPVVVENTAPPAIDIQLGDVARISPIGAAVPFVVRYAGNTTQTIRIDAAVGGVRVCNSPTASFNDITMGGSFSFLLGSEDASACDLAPDTLHDFEVCHTDFNGAVEYLCRVTQFRTSAVQTIFAAPTATTADRPSSDTMVLRGRKVVGPHPAGTTFVRSKLRGASDASFVNTPSVNVTRGTADVALANATVTTASPWLVHEFQSCFQGAKLMCTPSTEVTAGFIAPQDATAVTSTTATVAGGVSSPWPTAQLLVRLGTANPGADDPRTALPLRTQVALPARASAVQTTPRTVDLTGLAPGTTYYFSVCVDVPAQTGIEGCSPVRSFTTTGTPAATPTPTPAPTATPAPTPTPTPTPSGGGTGGVTGGGSGAGTGATGGGTGAGGRPLADTTRPTGKLTVKGALRRRGKVRLSVSASDAGGIRSVSIKVGSKKPVSRRSLTLTLPARAGKVKVTVTITDAAGNTTILTRTLRVP